MTNVQRPVTQQQQPQRPVAQRPQPPTSGAVQVRGGGWYIKVAERLNRFRQDHPLWSVLCEPVVLQEQYAVFKAEIRDENGRIVSVGHKMVRVSENEDFVEAAETGAVGRALNFLGYDTAALLGKGE